MSIDEEHMRSKLKDLKREEKTVQEIKLKKKNIYIYI